MFFFFFRDIVDCSVVGIGYRMFNQIVDFFPVSFISGVSVGDDLSKQRHEAKVQEQTRHATKLNQSTNWHEDAISIAGFSPRVHDSNDNTSLYAWVSGTRHHVVKLRRTFV